METYTKLTLARSQAKRYTCWHSHLQKNVWKVMLMPVADPFCRKEANEVFGRTPMPVPITLRGQHELAACFLCISSIICITNFSAQMTTAPLRLP